MIQKFREFLRKRGIKSRMFIAFIVLPIGLMVFVFILYYLISMNIFISKNKQTSKTFVTLTEENIYLNTMKMEEELQHLSQQDIIYHLYDEPDNQQYIEDLQNYIKHDLYLKEQSHIQLYDAQEKLVYSDYHRKRIHAVGETSNKKAGTSWIYDKENDEIILAKRIYRENAMIGYVTCSFVQSVFSPSFSMLDDHNNMVIIVDKDGNYLFGSDILPNTFKLDLKDDKVRIDNVDYYIESSKLTGKDWVVVNMVASNYLLEEFHNFRNVTLVYGVAILVVLEIIATFVYRSIYDPLHNMLKTMRTVDENHLSGIRVVDEGNDEIHEVAENFNDLLDRIEELVKTVEVEQEQKRETQFQLLQAQINPHFLFNTLNTLHFLALMNDDKPVSEGIQALAKLLRNTIVDSKEMVTIKEEIENLKNYIIIQKLRYGDIFETVYNVDEDVWDCQILKFLLQPIVENSILHAFDEDREHQILTIRIKRQGHYLKVEIGDNGKGFNVSQVVTTNKNLSGIGIANIQDRIKLIYGEEYSMKIESVVDSGTIVTLLLPYVKGDLPNV